MFLQVSWFLTMALEFYIYTRVLISTTGIYSLFSPKNFVSQYSNATFQELLMVFYTLMTQLRY